MYVSVCVCVFEVREKNKVRDERSRKAFTTTFTLAVANLSFFAPLKHANEKKDSFFHFGCDMQR